MDLWKLVERSGEKMQKKPISAEEKKRFDEFMKQEHIAKNEWLAENLQEVTPLEFYRTIFPEGSFETAGGSEERKPNGLALEVRRKEDGGARTWVVTDDLEKFIELQDSPFSLAAPISYFGRSRAARNALFLHALAIDIDYVGLTELRNLIHQMNSERWFPKANFIINSGKGIHVYYLLDKPVPMYPNHQKYLALIKNALTRKLWNGYTSLDENPELLSIVQGFRIVGSPSKFGKEFPCRAFRFNPTPVTLQQLADCVSEFDDEYDAVQKGMPKEPTMTLEEARKQFPDWYESCVKHHKRGWYLNRAVYDYWKRRLSEIEVGHRYFAIMALAIYAKKCSYYDPKKNPNPVTEEELRQDAYSFLDPFEALTFDDRNHFDADDVEAALALFNDDYKTFPRKTVEKITALRIEPQNRRNGRAQKQHLGRIRAMQQFDDPEGRWRNVNGRPKGSGTAEAKVRDWREAHPDGTKSQCKKDTGLTYDTIRKWWGE